MITKSRVRELMRMACEKNNLPTSFADSVRVEWKDRFTARMGDANYSRMRIRLSTPLFSRASVEDQEDTVVHEMCHIIARHTYKYPIKPHGREWQLSMVRAGYKPTRTHSVDRTGLKRKSTKTQEASCSCAVHKITIKMWVGIQTDKSRRFCKRCKSKLVALPMTSAA